MKKFLIVVLYMFSPGLYAAEAQETVNRLVKGTLFSIVKGDISQYGNFADLMVVGYNQQRTLKEPHLDDGGNVVGYMQFKKKKIIRVLPKEVDSRSELWKEVQKKEVVCPVLQIVEPLITTLNITGNKASERNYYYSPERIRSKMITKPIFTGKEAVVEASLDLGALCYYKALTKGIEILQGKKNRAISIDALGTQVGFPSKWATPVAFEMITKFIKENPGEYASVVLFVKKRSEFVQFKKFMDQYEENK